MESNGPQIDLLDHGFVQFVDHMGGDDDIVNAARASFDGDGYDAKRNRKLIRHMMRSGHSSVFEQVVFKFRVRAPLFVFRQWLRHRTLSANEYSGRYAQMRPYFYLPESDRMQEQSTLNKQGSADALPPEVAKYIQQMMREQQEETYKQYLEYLDYGLTRELARINIPLSMYSTLVFTQNLHNLFHFINLRSSPHAQWEIKVYADAITELIKPFVPVALEAFEDYVLNAKSISAMEVSLLKGLVCSFGQDAVFSKLEGMLTSQGKKMNKREVREFKMLLAPTEEN